VHIVKTPGSARAIARTLVRPVGLVPTMGALHAGHLSLIERAAAENASVVASIFVNPLQFGPHEDFERYPRSFESDAALLEAAGVTLLYAPSAERMYPAGFTTSIDAGALGARLEGERRPGHFAGVASVVAKLLHAIEPTALYLGAKDAQQTAVIRAMVRDLDLATSVVVCRTTREPDGLALSSRNAYLTPEQRTAAPSLHRALDAIASAIALGERDRDRALAAGKDMLERPLVWDYLEIVDPVSFAPLESAAGPALVVAAARAGATRLLDNASVAAPDGVDPLVTAAPPPRTRTTRLMARILLGVCGGIAAYKAAALASALVQRGDRVDVILTDGAQHFVGPLTFAALTRNPVYTSLWDAPETIPHISLVRAADVLAIVPATANLIAKLAHGIADDLLTNAALAARIPIIVAPAMNDAMYEHPATRENLRVLEARGIAVVAPDVGFLAERETGIGRLAEEDAILAAIDGALSRVRDLEGQRVLITAGPTREAIDPVRFLSNASTGTMGIELAREALARGARVDLILGPTLVDPPDGANVVRVTSAQEMHDAALAHFGEADIVIAAAAVADWRPVQTFAQKIKKHDERSTIQLDRTPDVLAAIGERNCDTFLVGFAAETESIEANAREKLRSKGLDAIAVNDVSGSSVGFGSGDNELVVLWGESDRRELGRAPKREMARRLWDALQDIREHG